MGMGKRSRTRGVWEVDLEDLTSPVVAAGVAAERVQAVREMKSCDKSKRKHGRRLDKRVQSLGED